MYQKYVDMPIKAKNTYCIYNEDIVPSYHPAPRPERVGGDQPKREIPMKFTQLAGSLVAATVIGTAAQADKLDDIISSGTLRCALLQAFQPMR